MPRKAKTTPSNQRIRAGRPTSKTAEPAAETAMPSQEVTTEPVNWMKRLTIALSVLGVIYFIAWIVIGLFVLLVIVQGIRHGQYAGLLGSGNSTAQQAPQDNSSTNQTEVNLPGIGMVNVSCVQSALSADSLQKVIQARSIDVLSGDEKTRFQACITQPATSPAGSSTDQSASPSTNQ